MQALKALILEKLGKVEEASELALRAKAANPLDDITLNTLQTVFQRLKMCAYLFRRFSLIFWCSCADLGSVVC